VNNEHVPRDLFSTSALLINIHELKLLVLFSCRLASKLLFIYFLIPKPRRRLIPTPDRSQRAMENSFAKIVMKIVSHGKIKVQRRERKRAWKFASRLNKYFA
jgi:hypothetical protein